MTTVLPRPFAKTFRRLIVFSAVALAFGAEVATTTSLSAQNRSFAPAAAVKPATVAVTFSIVSLDQDIPNLKYDSAGRVANIKVIPSNFKPLPLPYSGPEVLEIYRETKDADGKPLRNVVASAKFPASSGNFLILVKSIGPNRYGTLVLPDALTPESANSWRVINVASRHIAFQMKDFKKQVVIAPAQSALLELGPKEGYSEVVTYLPDAKNPKAWAMAHSTRRFYTPGRPSLLIYHDDTNDPGHLNVTRLESAVKSSTSATTGAGANQSRRGASTNSRRH